MTSPHPPKSMPRRLGVPGADRLLVVLSDIEMGSGGPQDDFPHTDFLADLLDAYCGPEFADLAVDLVFNGDTFDFLKTPVGGAYPRHVTAEVALAKVEAVASAHGAFFEALRRFVSFTQAPRKAWFVVGNHDQELVFPQVRRRLRQLVGAYPDRLVFPGLTVDFGDVRIEHGSQGDRMFSIDPRRPFLEHQGETILNLPWASVALLDVAMPLKSSMFFLDRCKPRENVLGHVPEVRDLLLGAFWTYWTRDYWRGVFDGSDPVRRLSWTMFREVVYRFGTADPNVPLTDVYLEQVQSGSGHKLLVLGHTHKPQWTTVADRKLLEAGCLRNEYAIDPDGAVLGKLPKVYVEVYLRGDRVARSHLVEIEGPEDPPGYALGHVKDVLPAVRPLLGSREEQSALQAERDRQEAKEASEAPLR